jgi:hypothetical protein
VATTTTSLFGIFGSSPLYGLFAATCGAGLLALNLAAHLLKTRSQSFNFLFLFRELGLKIRLDLLASATKTENTAIGTAALVHNDAAVNNTATGAFALFRHISSAFSGR